MTVEPEVGLTTDRSLPGVTSVDPASLRPRSRIIGLDGLRGIACIGVLVLHVSSHYSPTVTQTFKIGIGGQGLIVFFALSGFLLYLPYVNAITRDRAAIKLPDTRTFALHRFLRVFPGYVVVFLLCSFLLRAVYLENAAIQAPGTDNGTGMMTDPVELVANLTLVQTYFPQYFQTGLNPSWSLTLELVFYLTLPLFGLLMLGLRRRTKLSPLLVASIAPTVLLVIGLVGQTLAFRLQRHFNVYDPLLMEWGPNWVAVWNRSFLSLASTFTFGMLAAVIFVAIRSGALTGHFAKRIRWYCAAAIVPATLAGILLIMLLSHYFFTVVALVAGLMVLFIVAPIARGEDSTFARLVDWRPFKYVGEVSLSAYLWHFPVLIVLGRLGWMAGDTVGGMLRNVALVLVVTLVLASVTYRYIEKPSLALAKRYKPRPA
jgi:peptidoglycan/LPS O-acetylase OafA/YrhL